MGFLYEQLFTFSVSIVYGIFVGVIFDFYRTLRGKKKINRILSDVLDLLIWLVITVIFIFVLLSSNWGEVRAYVFMGLVMGVLIYYSFFSSFITEGYRNLFSLIKKLFNLILKYIIVALGFFSVPVLFFLKMIKKLCDLLLKLANRLKKLIKRNN
ncbi:spore cortex biosynthesis protein YabQ [Natranaerofaba carboxydovora]|uniref:spore cortex biosynthesis protein YabQ n=1 Tax=Natranaerofaba carboxydovora TaxID=2742683 RepID=UPI001F144D9B|nr:spore cortex biosynthesis protein YabQ [Natranaerofaba carboxydovora]UMZ75281.1 Spore protein YabQ [Natranaerofaba carboxydovora]